MLSEEERKRIDEEVAILPRRDSACIEALKVVQEHRRWVDDDAVRDVAEYLGMSVEAVDGVATFYNLIYRRPVGRHVIHRCDSVSCWILGADRVREALESRLGIREGESSADGRFTLLPIACLGACDRAPVMIVDRNLHANLAPDDLDPVLEEYP